MTKLTETDDPAPNADVYCIRCLLIYEKSGSTQVRSILIKLKIWNAVREGEGIFDKSNQPIPNLVSCDITSYYVSEVVSLYITFQEKKNERHLIWRLCIYWSQNKMQKVLWASWKQHSSKAIKNKDVIVGSDSP